jgi:hypothetical protein
MEDVDVVAVVINSASSARVREAGLLLHWQGIHVGSEQRRGSVAVAQDPHNSGPPHARRRVEAQCPQTAREDSGGSLLLKGQLGMPVQVAVELG